MLGDDAGARIGDVVLDAGTSSPTQAMRFTSPRSIEGCMIAPGTTPASSWPLTSPATRLVLEFMAMTRIVEKSS
jgi:hypothetical protein